jgi:hypothetical protein
MEVRGLILLRISQAEYGKISVAVDNDDKLGFQMQVCWQFSSSITSFTPFSPLISM